MKFEHVDLPRGKSDATIYSATTKLCVCFSDIIKLPEWRICLYGKRNLDTKHTFPHQCEYERTKTKLMALPHVVEYDEKYMLSPIFQDYDLATSHSRVATLIISHLNLQLFAISFISELINGWAFVSRVLRKPYWVKAVSLHLIVITLKRAISSRGRGYNGSLSRKWLSSIIRHVSPSTLP